MKGLINVKNEKMFNIVMQGKFKDEIMDAVAYVDREASFVSDRYSKSFMGVIITYNPIINSTSMFRVFEYGDFTDEKQVNDSITELLNRIKKSEKYNYNNVITTIKAMDIFEMSRRNNKFELENFALNLYLSVLNQYY
jgi:uncharacterized protein (UPF0305 family)